MNHPNIQRAVRFTVRRGAGCLLRRSFFALSLLFNACAKRETPVAAGIRTQTLLLGNGAEPVDLDPHVANTINDGRILYALFEGLTWVDEKTGRALPAVAERWDVSPDGLVYTFHLRSGLRWSNGDKLTATDFVFSFQRMLDPQLAAAYAYMLWPIRGTEAFTKGTQKDFSAVGAKALDERTLRLELEQPTAYLPSLAGHFTWLPVHRSTLEKHDAVARRGTRWTRAGNLVGNGAFMLSEWTPNARIVTKKNPAYWDASATRLSQIVFLPIENADVEERNFRAGQMHVTWELPIAKTPAYRGENTGRLRSDLLLGTRYLCFNVAKPPVSDVRVRRALALAIDRETISRAITFGTWPAAYSFTPPNSGGYTARAGVRHDFDTARRLLAEAGYADGKGLPEIPLQVANGLHGPELAEALQGMWQRELGVRVTIERVELKTHWQNLTNKTHTMAIWGWVADFTDPVTFLELFLTNGGNNCTNWSNADYDTLISESAKSIDPGARFEVLQHAESLLLEQAPIAPIEHFSRVFLIHPSVKGWEPSLLDQHRYKNVWLENQKD